MLQQKKRVIIITDGDEAARRAIEKVAEKVGGRCISLSAGNPTALSGDEIAKLILMAPSEPVLVMVDDRGYIGEGKGEKALRELSNHPEIEILGVVAVASNTPKATPIEVDFSITNSGEKIKGAVDKKGEADGDYLSGDTVEHLNNLNIPYVVGIGDIGKMKGKDRLEKGVPVTTKAVEEILKRSGFYEKSSGRV